MTKENDKKVIDDLRDQSKTVEGQITDLENIHTKQDFIFSGLGSKQQTVLDDLDKESDKLEAERKKLLQEKENLQGQVREIKAENELKKNRNEAMEGQIGQLQVKVEAMEDHLDKLVLENAGQFTQY